MPKVVLNVELMIPFFPEAKNIKNLPRKKKKRLKNQMSKFIVNMLNEELYKLND